MRTQAAAIVLLPLLALSGCSAPIPQIEVTHIPHGVQSPFPDEGPAAARTAVRASLLDALTAEEDQLARTAAGEPLAPEEARSIRLRSLESAALADSDLAAMDLLTAHDTPFRSSHFAVRSWQGIAVRGDRARAAVLGHHVYELWDGTTRSGPVSQYNALLHRSGRAQHGWLLTGYRAASDDQG